MSAKQDPCQLAMIGIKPGYRLSPANRYVSLSPAMDRVKPRPNSPWRVPIKLELAGPQDADTSCVEKSRRAGAAVLEKQRVLQGDNLKDIEQALGGKKLSLVLICWAELPVAILAKSLKPGRLDCQLRLSAAAPGHPANDFIYVLSHHGFWLVNFGSPKRAPDTEIQEI